VTGPDADSADDVPRVLPRRVTATYQADIDAACETVDFLRANVQNMLAMYEVQSGSQPGVWSQVDGTTPRGR
jgi:hypothetical protein